MQSKVLQQFEIEIYSLEDKEYRYDFDIKDEFFGAIEQDLVEKGNLKANVILNKSSMLIQMTFKISGKIELICDRSLEPFDQEIETEEVINFRFGDEYLELSDDLIQITNGTPSINIAQFIYEFIAVQVPFKKLHPKFRNEEDDDSEEDTLVYTSDSDSSDEREDDDTPPSEDNIDPRWKDLLKLRNN